MSLYKIKTFSEIDFLNIDVLNDTFKLPDGECYKFADHMCDFCRTPGTVLESSGNKKTYQCILCNEKLKWQEWINDFVEPKGDKIKFLIPQSWPRNKSEKWFEDFKKSRLAEENVKNHILKFGKI